MPAADRSRYVTRVNRLWTERSSWDDHWRDLSRYILPRRLRFNYSDANEGTKRHQYIVNNVATRALRVLASGMMAGITSPARRWFRLTVPDLGLGARRDVRVWLDEVERRIFEVFARSNVYNALAIMYADLGCYGTTAITLERDLDDVIRAQVWPIGSYALTQDERHRVNGASRKMRMTVEQMGRRFGKQDKMIEGRTYGLSERVKNLLEQGRLDEWIDVTLVVEPNDDYSVGMSDIRGKKWRGVWYEDKGEENKLLLVEGFNEFPILAPRWSVVGEDVYGAAPGMDALGDIKQLQFYEKRRSEGYDKAVRPPMRGPTSLQRRRKSIVAGAITYVDAVGQRGTFEPSVVIDPRIFQMGDTELARFEGRIASTFYADLFLMMTSTNIPQMTAREVEERHEEKMLQLGPVLERLHDELLDPLIDRTFNIMLRAGLLPEIPQALSDVDLRVEYLSILAQAQKLIGTVSVERLFTFGTQLSQYNPYILDKLDMDKALDEYGELLGAAADLLRADEDVAQLRQQRQAQEQADRLAAQTQAAGSAARDMAGADLSNDTALSRLLGAAGGGATGAAA